VQPAVLFTDSVGRCMAKPLRPHDCRFPLAVHLLLSLCCPPFAPQGATGLLLWFIDYRFAIYYALLLVGEPVGMLQMWLAQAADHPAAAAASPAHATNCATTPWLPWRLAAYHPPPSPLVPLSSLIPLPFSLCSHVPLLPAAAVHGPHRGVPPHTRRLQIAGGRRAR